MYLREWMHYQLASIPQLQSMCAPIVVHLQKESGSLISSPVLQQIPRHLSMTPEPLPRIEDDIEGYSTIETHAAVEIVRSIYSKGARIMLRIHLLLDVPASNTMAIAREKDFAVKRLLGSRFLGRALRKPRRRERNAQSHGFTRDECRSEVFATFIVADIPSTIITMNGKTAALPAWHSPSRIRGGTIPNGKGTFVALDRLAN